MFVQICMYLGTNIEFERFKCNFKKLQFIMGC